MTDVAGISSEMAQLIRLKERELHEVQDMRCNALEKLIEERDHANADLSRRFDQLKEDFSYNLTLLEARDQEIDRLEGQMQEKSTALEDIETERRTLMTRIEVLELRETQSEEKHSQERSNNRRILQELKDAIESMKWAASEESKTKQRQIEVLREDNRVLAASREEGLESQRRDLTNTFEQLILHREKHYGAREKKLGSQILALDEKFETLNTENSRLKSELQACQRLVESQQMELLQGKEKQQNLQWQIDDERNNKQRLCDALERQVQSLNAEIDTLKDTSGEKVMTLMGQMESAQQDAEREKQFRITLEKRLNEYRDNSKLNMHYLETELLAKGGTENKMKTELLALQSERDRLTEALEMIKQEASTNRRMVEDAQNENDTTTNVLSRTRQELDHAKKTLDAKNAELELSLNRASQREQELMDELSSAEKASEALNVKLREKEDTEKVLEKRISEIESLLTEEREEAAGLRLRLRLQESQVHALKADASALTKTPVSEGRIDPNASDNTSGIGVIVTKENQKQAQARGLGLSQNSEEVSSPIFSEDYGPVSLPASPQASPNPNKPITMAGSSDSASAFGLGLRASQPPPPTQAASIDTHPISLGTVKATSGAADQGLIEENERLRKVIRDMRLDVESLQQQVSNQSHMDIHSDGRVDSNKEAAPDSRSPQEYEELRTRLEKTTAEVVRLKAERKTLMDIGNELRSALNQEWSKVASGDRQAMMPPVPPIKPYGIETLHPRDRSGPMFYDYRYEPPRHVQAQQHSQAREDFVLPDAITVVNAFDGDFQDQPHAASEITGSIGVRGRQLGAPASGGGGGFQRGYGASAGRAGVNTHSGYAGTGSKRSASAGRSSGPSRPPTANAMTRAASAAANRQPRKVMNYAAGLKGDQANE